ncbi:unnamed protein product [Protopolystoma xenopodis]|uniref:Uncharacterized protein n=1 Tax=Protopolystoma xenopodis TaxID=117903 RepID=A0A3S5ATT6_9PLAT|nr:unnamed protein product [Protopolystoma xenopodis]
MGRKEESYLRATFSLDFLLIPHPHSPPPPAAFCECRRERPSLTNPPDRLTILRKTHPGSPSGPVWSVAGTRERTQPAARTGPPSAHTARPSVRPTSAPIAITLPSSIWPVPHAPRGHRNTDKTHLSDWLSHPGRGKWVYEPDRVGITTFVAPLVYSDAPPHPLRPGVHFMRRHTLHVYVPIALGPQEGGAEAIIFCEGEREGGRETNPIGCHTDSLASKDAGGKTTFHNHAPLP